MNIYKVSRKDGADYDQFRAFVCYAKTVDRALNMNPEDGTQIENYNTKSNERLFGIIADVWELDKEKLEVEFLGTSDTTEESIILADYKAG